MQFFEERLQRLKICFGKKLMNICLTIGMRLFGKFLGHSDVSAVIHSHKTWEGFKTFLTPMADRVEMLCCFG